MRYKGVVKGGVVVMEPGVKLPEGATVQIELAPAAKPALPPRRSLLERLSSVVGKAEGLPSDAARNIDRDLYGQPGA